NRERVAAGWLRQGRRGHTGDRVSMYRFVLALGALGMSWGSGSCTEAVLLGHELGASASGAGASAARPGAGAGGDGAPAAGTGGAEFPLGGAGGASGGAPPSPDADAGPCQPRPCGGRVRACGDCSDDDGDGAIDAADPDCLGPCDDSEGELFNGTA